MMARGTGMVQTDAARASRWLAGHVRYLQYRQRGPQEGRDARWVFSATHDQVRPGEVLSALVGSRRSQVVVHKLILSTEEERVTDWRTWTRQVMRDLAKQQGQPMCWFGVLHRNTDIPHVHVVLAGALTPRPRTPLTLMAASSRQRPMHLSTSGDYRLEARAQGGAERESHP